MNKSREAVEFVLSNFSEGLEIHRTFDEDKEPVYSFTKMNQSVRTEIPFVTFGELVSAYLSGVWFFKCPIQIGIDLVGSYLDFLFFKSHIAGSPVHVKNMKFLYWGDYLEVKQVENELDDEIKVRF